MLARYIRSLARGLTTLAFEEVCLICGVGNEALCANCQKVWSNQAREIIGESFPIFTKAVYDDSAAKVVLSAKESGIVAAKAILAEAIADSTLTLLKEQNFRDGRVDLVPIPSSRRARTRRGEDFLYELAKLTRSILSKRAPLVDFQVSQILKLRKLTKDQSNLSERERALNLSGAFYSISKSHTATHQVILDDVVTTGSTLREAFRALKERNLTVLGAATACASQRRLLIR